MKITLISFDFWHYDGHIIETLRNKGIEATHINIGAYQHPNLAARLQNTASKIIFNKNLKNKRRQEEMMSKLQEIGLQDKILVINPELIDRNYHEQIKKYTREYIAYLYDSVSRSPVHHLLDLFDKIFSFDPEDVKNFGFNPISNYNYLNLDPKWLPSPKYDLVLLSSIDSRMEKALKILEKAESMNLSAKYYIIGKKTRFLKLFKKSSSSIHFSAKRIPHDQIPVIYSEGKVILDLLRENQTGLSFRIFEAMGLQRKVITDNASILDYDFYNPKNILLLKDIDNLSKSFFETPYEPLPPDLFKKYHLNHWVENIFDLP